jgi:hypothetical protein
VFCKVTGAKHEVGFERSEMIEEIEFIEKGLEEPLTGDRICDVD